MKKIAHFVSDDFKKPVHKLEILVDMAFLKTLSVSQLSERVERKLLRNHRQAAYYLKLIHCFNSGR